MWSFLSNVIRNDDNKNMECKNTCLEIVFLLFNGLLKGLDIFIYDIDEKFEKMPL
jgi:hypothetical protein